MRLGEKSLYHRDGLSVVSPLLTCPSTPSPQPSHKPTNCAWIGYLAASTSPSLPHALPRLGQTGQVPSNAIIPMMSSRNTSVGNCPVLPLSLSFLWAWHLSVLLSRRSEHPMTHCSLGTCCTGLLEQDTYCFFGFPKLNNPGVFHTEISTGEKVVYSAHYKQMSSQTFSIRNRTRLKLISK